MVEICKKSLRDELKESEDLHRSVVKAMAEGMIFRDAEKIVREVNSSAQSILGLKAEEMLGKKSFDVDWKVVAENGLPFAKGEHPATASLRTGRACRNVIMGILRDGLSPLWISVSSEPLFRKKEKVPYAVVTTFSDITQRKEDEEKIRKSQKQLHDITSSIAEGVYVLNKDGQITFLNPEGEKLLGYTQEELLNKNSHNTFHYHTQYEDCPVSKTLTNGDKIRTDDDFFVRKDHSLLPVSYITAPIMEEKQITGCVVAFKDITERKNYEKLIKFQAYHDALTGLPNRLLFNDRLSIALAQAKRNNALLGVIFLDFDNFKVINDELGHDVGDILLKRVAERLVECVRVSDTVARLGGDEFIILLPDIKCEQDIAFVAVKIIECFQRPFDVGVKELSITSSVGISYYPKDGEEASRLIKKADIAMYQAKRRKNTYVFYKED